MWIKNRNYLQERYAQNLAAGIRAPFTRLKGCHALLFRRAKGGIVFEGILINLVGEVASVVIKYDVDHWDFVGGGDWPKSKWLDMGSRMGRMVAQISGIVPVSAKDRGKVGRAKRSYAMEKLLKSFPKDIDIQYVTTLLGILAKYVGSYIYYFSYPSIGFKETDVPPVDHIKINESTASYTAKYKFMDGIRSVQIQSTMSDKDIIDAIRFGISIAKDKPFLVVNQATDNIKKITRKYTKRKR